MDEDYQRKERSEVAPVIGRYRTVEAKNERSEIREDDDPEVQEPQWGVATHPQRKPGGEPGRRRSDIGIERMHGLFPRAASGCCRRIATASSRMSNFTTPLTPPRRVGILTPSGGSRSAAWPHGLPRAARRPRPRGAWGLRRRARNSPPTAPTGRARPLHAPPFWADS